MTTKPLLVHIALLSILLAGCAEPMDVAPEAGGESTTTDAAADDVPAGAGLVSSWNMSIPTPYHGARVTFDAQAETNCTIIVQIEGRTEDDGPVRFAILERNGNAAGSSASWRDDERIWTNTPAGELESDDSDGGTYAGKTTFKTVVEDSLSIIAINARPELWGFWELDHPTFISVVCEEQFSDPQVRYIDAAIMFDTSDFEGTGAGLPGLAVKSEGILQTPLQGDNSVYTLVSGGPAIQQGSLTLNAAQGSTTIPLEPRTRELAHVSNLQSMQLNWVGSYYLAGAAIQYESPSEGQ